MHLVAIASTANMGGAEASLIELIRRLNRKICVSVVLPADGELRICCEQAGLEVRIVPWPESLAKIGESSMVRSLLRISTVFHVMKTIRALRACLREMNADLVITNGLKAHMLGALACRSERLLLWYLREGLERRGKTAALLKILWKHSSGGIAISDYVKRSWRRVTGEKPITVIYNIVEQAAFADAPCPPDLKKEMGEIWFCVIGALTPIKGQDVFIEAASRLRLPQARFLIAGTNFYESESREFEDSLRELVKRLALTEQVSFLGFRKDVTSLLKVTDVLVQPNRGPEGLGRAVLEAMAAGVPVVTPDRWGPAEIVQQAGSGLMFEAGNTEQLARQMLRLAADPALRRQFGSAGRAWVEKNLVPEELVQKFETFISERTF